jgi:hypothetical protein
MPDSEPFNEPTDEERKAALDQFDGEMRAAMERPQSISPEELNAALSTVTDFLRTSWSSGGGRRLRHFVWSLWNGWHLVNLFDLSHGLDATLPTQLLLCFGPLWSVR